MARDTAPSLTALERLVTDALLLLDYAIGSGAKSADGYAIADDIVTTIEATADKLGLLDGKSASTAALSASDWAAFDVASPHISAFDPKRTSQTRCYTVTFEPPAAYNVEGSSLKTRPSGSNWVCP